MKKPIQRPYTQKGQELKPMLALILNFIIILAGPCTGRKSKREKGLASIVCSCVHAKVRGEGHMTLTMCLCLQGTKKNELLCSLC